MISTMSQLSQSVLGIYNVQWNAAPQGSPANSGVYLTRDDRNQTWFKYFDAYWGQWYMSCAELKSNTARNTARVSQSDLLSHVVAWAHRTRAV